MRAATLMPGILAALIVAPALPALEVNVTVGIDTSFLAGTDPGGRVLIYTPNPVEPGSSTSHWDRSAFPNLLMEPSASSSLPFNQVDLTVPFFRDIGWPTGSSNVVLRVQDAAGQGFNSPSLGGPRMAAMQHVANRWASQLGSSVTINVDVSFDELPCDNGSGVLAQAGPEFIFENFAGAPIANTWYSGAEAEALSGANLSTTEDGFPANAGDLSLTFNSRIDDGCLGGGSGFYYGLDNNLPVGRTSFVNVALHEMAHGLGFLSFVNESSGAWLTAGGLTLPDIAGRFYFDNDQRRHWDDMTNSQRAASAVNDRRVGFDGSRVTAQAPNWLEPGPSLRINAPASIAGNYRIGTADFGPPLTVQGITGSLVLARDASANPTLVCNPVANPGEVAGKVALIDRGVCNFTVKVKHAQNAGAIAVVIANNAQGPPPGLGGTDGTIVIPAVSVSIQDGQLIKNALATADPSALLQFSSTAYGAGEGDGSATITVTRTGTTDTAVGVEYATSDGTATAGLDYSSVAGTLSFAAGETSKTFAVTVLEDMEEEGSETIVLSLSNPSGEAVLGDPATATLTIGDNEPCVAGAQTLCLNGGRFRVRVAWRDFEDDTGPGSVVPFGADDSGLMWFFDADNWEMLIKVLNGCGFNGNYWVFSAATTNVEYTLTVEDTVTGAVREYVNPLGNAADALTDIEAFATCP
ncbi:MAG: Calx-beta domain-containing protein [Thermoanaerobaculia bacterium]